MPIPGVMPNLWARDASNAGAPRKLKSGWTLEAVDELRKLWDDCDVVSQPGWSQLHFFGYFINIGWILSPTYHIDKNIRWDAIYD